ncbi:MAG: helix-turn-helix domain-containing protein [Planctomycetes bacterium]|nr:helix-turn-helix domain-containing protein [Planctomycetota bacterium]
MVQLRRRHGLSRQAFANLTGLGVATIARWERGLLIQNKANDRYMRLLDTRAAIEALRAVDTGAGVRDQDEQVAIAAPEVGSVPSGKAVPVM